MRVDDLRRGRRCGLFPSRGNDGRILIRSEDVPDLETVLLLAGRVQFGGLRERLGWLLRPTEFVQDLGPVRPGPFQVRVRLEEAVVVFQFLRESIRLGRDRAGRGDPLPAVEEVLDDALRPGGGLGDARDQRPTNRAFSLLRKEVGAASGAEGSGLVEVRLQARQQREPFGVVLAPAHRAGRRFGAHRRATGLTNSGGVFFLEEIGKLAGQFGFLRAFELDAAKSAPGGPRTGEGPAFRTEEQMLSGVVGGSAEQPEQGIDEGWRQAYNREEFLT